MSSKSGDRTSTEHADDRHLHFLLRFIFVCVERELRFFFVRRSYFSNNFRSVAFFFFFRLHFAGFSSTFVRRSSPLCVDSVIIFPG